MNDTPRAGWWRPGLTVKRECPVGATVAVGSKVRHSSVPFWALVAFTFILLVAPQAFIPALRPFHIALLTGAVALCTYLFDRLIHREPIASLTGELRITVCLLGWAVLTVPLSYWPGGSVSFILNFYVKTLVIFWLLSNVVNTQSRLHQIAWALTIIGVPLAITAVGNYLSGTFLPEGHTYVANRIVGYEAPLTDNPNDLALMLCLILPLNVALLQSSRRAVLRVALLGFTLLAVIAVIVTFSRAGFLTLTTIFGMYLWQLLKRRRWGWALVALAIALPYIALLPSGYSNRLWTIWNIDTDRTGSAQARWDDTVAAANFVIRNPIIGAGVGMDALALNDQRGVSWGSVHNVYLQYAVDLGLSGLVLFLLLLVRCIKAASRVQQRSAGTPRGGEVFYLSQAIKISLVAFAVAGLFFPVAYHFYFYYFAGLAMGLKAISNGDDRNVGPVESVTKGLTQRGEA